jgi:hypothetical protein
VYVELAAAPAIPSLLPIRREKDSLDLGRQKHMDRKYTSFSFPPLRFGVIGDLASKYDGEQ